MKRHQYLWILCILVVHNDAIVRRFQMRKGRSSGGLGNVVDEQSGVASLANCISHCAKTGDHCKSLNYDDQTKSCRLLGEGVGADSAESSSSSYSGILVIDSEVTTNPPTEVTTVPPSTEQPARVYTCPSGVEREFNRAFEFGMYSSVSVTGGYDQCCEICNNDPFCKAFSYTAGSNPDLCDFHYETVIKNSYAAAGKTYETGKMDRVCLDSTTKTANKKIDGLVSLNGDLGAGEDLNNDKNSEEVRCCEQCFYNSACGAFYVRRENVFGTIYTHCHLMSSISVVDKLFIEDTDAYTFN